MFKLKQTHTQKESAEDRGKSHSITENYKDHNI